MTDFPNAVFYYYVLHQNDSHIPADFAIDLGRLSQYYGVEKFESGIPRMDLASYTEDIAQEYFDNGGWEDKWPLTFMVYDENKIFLGEFLVEREDVPTFTAIQKEK